jgi:hypothetical protein
MSEGPLTAALKAALLARSCLRRSSRTPACTSVQGCPEIRPGWPPGRRTIGKLAGRNIRCLVPGHRYNRMRLHGRTVLTRKRCGDVDVVPGPAPDALDETPVSDRAGNA